MLLVRRLIISSSILILIASPVLANTYSADFERDNIQYLSIADGTQTGLEPSTYLTIEADYKMESANNFAYIVYKHNAYLAQRQYSMTIGADNLITCNIADVGTTNSMTVTNNTALSVGVWYHVACSFNTVSDIANISIDGVDDTASYSGTSSGIRNGTAPFQIGAYLGSSIANTLDGLLDNVRIWSSYRTASDVLADYQTELTGSETDLQGYWRMENDFLDETANNNDLTNNNSVSFSLDIPDWTQEEATTSTTTIDMYPCEIPENWLIQNLVGCENVYTDSTTTPSEVHFYYFDIKMILFLFLYLMLGIVLAIIFLYVFTHSKK